MKKKLILVICIMLLLFCAIETATAKTWYVDDSGGADFTRVQDTVDDASAGGTIIVHRGHDGGSPNTHVNANNQGFLWLELPNPLNIISVAVAQEQVPCDPFADSYCYLNCDGSFNAVEKSVNEPIFDPREIEERLWGDLDTLHIDKYLRQEKNLNGAVWYDKEGYAHYDIFKISEMDAAVWLDKHWGIGCGELESARQIYPIDTDGDGIADTLMCGLHKSYLRNTDLGPISDSIVRCDDGYYLLDLFHTPENKSLSGMQKLLYTNPNYKNVLLNGIHHFNWDDLVGKTPAEIWLDKDDIGIFGKTPDKSQTPEPDTTEEIPTGEEKGIPGFEVISTIAGLLAVAYLLRRQNK